MESVNEEIIHSQMLYLLDPVAEDIIPADTDWPLNLPTTDLHLFSSDVQKIDHVSEDEFVDVEGGFPNAEDEEISQQEITADTGSIDLVGVPPELEADPHKTPNSTTILCAKCVKPFQSMEECRKHMQNAHNWTSKSTEGLTKKSALSKRSSLSYKRCIKVPPLNLDTKRAVAVDEIAKPVSNFTPEMLQVEEPKEINVIVIRKESLVPASENIEDVKCRVCSLQFSKQEHLDHHIACHVKGQIGFTCFLCKGYFRKWKACSDHLWKDHKIDTLLLSCELCDMKFPKAYLLATHQKEHLDEKQYICDVCNKAFKLQVHLKLHKSTHIPKEKRSSSRKCDVCQRLYSGFRSLKQHMRSVHSAEKAFACTECDFRTNRKALLQTHMRSHTGERPFCCEVCDCRFADHNTFRRHKMLHLDIKQYQCPYCTCSFIQSSCFKQHILQKHPGLENGLVMQCQSCPFNTINTEGFYFHIQKHYQKDISNDEDAKERSTGCQIINPIAVSSTCDMNFECILPVPKEILSLATCAPSFQVETQKVSFDVDGNSQLCRPPTPSILDELPAELVQVYQNTL